MREEKVSTQLGDMDAYLIEARSIGGLSGSPAYVEAKGMRGSNDAIFTLTQGRLFLLGLIHGHWDEEAAQAVGGRIHYEAQ